MREFLFSDFFFGKHDHVRQWYAVAWSAFLTKNDLYFSFFSFCLRPFFWLDYRQKWPSLFKEALKLEMQRLWCSKIFHINQRRTRKQHHSRMCPSLEDTSTPLPFNWSIAEGILYCYNSKLELMEISRTRYSHTLLYCNFLGEKGNLFYLPI